MEFEAAQRLADNISRVMVGKKETIKLLLTALLAEGHVLLEDVPGAGKTLLARSLAQSIGGSFQRIQFTPDMLPSDVTGFYVYQQRQGEFVFQPGPIITNVLLADEINRTIPRTQSSLLECMEEGQATVEGVTRPLPPPFLVIATQNPIELEGTFPLPEAQLDRFLMKISLGYPTLEEEMHILDRFQEEDPLASLEWVTTPEQVVEMQQLRRKILVSPPVKDYLLRLVNATRSSSRLSFGASPRASLSLMRSGQALAALNQRDYVLPDDIQELALPVLGHRLLIKTEEQMRGVTAEKVIEEILETVEVPAPVE